MYYASILSNSETKRFHPMYFDSRPETFFRSVAHHKDGFPTLDEARECIRSDPGASDTSEVFSWDGTLENMPPR